MQDCAAFHRIGLHSTENTLNLKLHWIICVDNYKQRWVNKIITTWKILFLSSWTLSTTLCFPFQWLAVETTKISSVDSGSANDPNRWSVNRAGLRRSRYDSRISQRRSRLVGRWYRDRPVSDGSGRFQSVLDWKVSGPIPTRGLHRRLPRRLHHR